jgi:tetraacyldisaccharide 4'-kinase
MIYESVTGLRNYFYDHGWLTSAPVARSVISIGNITMGGTGKTPFVDLLLDFCRNQNIPAGVISRGYGRQTRGVLEAKNVSAEQCGDEPALLQMKHPESAVFVGERRVLAAQALLEKYPQVRILFADDAFQHRGLKRDIDVVLIDASQPTTSLQMFPRGWARESIKNLKRADYIVITKLDANQTLESKMELHTILSDHCRRSVFERRIECRLRYGKPRDLLSGQAVELTAPLRLLAVSAIGSPQPFEQAVQSEFRPRELRCLRFRDHHPYTQQNIEKITAAVAEGFETIVTTEKDAVKLRDLVQSSGLQSSIRWLVLPMAFEASKNIERLYENIRSLALLHL